MPRAYQLVPCALSDQRRTLVDRLLLRHRLLGRRRFDVEQGADPLEGLDPAGLARLRAQLAANARDPDAEVLEVVSILGAPDLGQQLGVEHDLAGIGG